jgi:hypothetical protein
MKKQCIVLHESVSRDEISSLAYERSWCFAKAITDSEDIVREVIYETMKTKSRIHYVIEKVRNLPYLIIQGEVIDSAVKGIYAALPVYSRAEIIHMISAPKDEEEYLKGILYLGLQGKFQEPDNETLDVFKDLLKNKFSETRIHVIVAMSYAGWSEFQDLGKSLAENDPDPNVREAATRFLKGDELP